MTIEFAMTLGILFNIGILSSIRWYQLQTVLNNQKAEEKEKANDKQSRKTG